METLELQPLADSIAALKRFIEYYRSKDETSPDIEVETAQTAVIKAFEFTYEISWKFMRKWIEVNFSANEVDGITRKELFRISAENRLIDSAEQWFLFNKARNMTSHTYNERTVEYIMELSETLLTSAENLLERLTERL
ncbi:MAG: nucleotidyltransferase substrate binding protein [Oscillospiraceae bacterium]|jgi:nucleotidyltransferase substrate binding protein (TIGR01987 family)|nr:nucleotidyltransferase substrate binding protein [Oscillospiraceae bacterium]